MHACMYVRMCARVKGREGGGEERKERRRGSWDWQVDKEGKGKERRELLIKCPRR